jgi:hypothetical protein
LTPSERKIEISDTIICVESLVPKDEIVWITLIILLDNLLAHPDCKLVKVLSDKYIITRKQVVFRKIIRYKKEETNVETANPINNDKYLSCNLNINCNYIAKFAHRLTGYVSEENDDILMKT